LSGLTGTQPINIFDQDLRGVAPVKYPKETVKPLSKESQKGKQMAEADKVQVRKSYQYRLYPTRQQEKLLLGQLEYCRELYNAALTERRLAYQRWKETSQYRGVEKPPFITYLSQANQLKEIRQARPELATVNYSAMRDALHRLDKAFKAFFDRVKSGQKPGFPRYKGRNRYDSITYPSYGDGCKLRGSGVIYIQNVGNIKFKQHRNVGRGEIKTVTIRRDGSHWYVSFSCCYEFEPVTTHTGGTIGIDLGLEHFANLSNGVQVENPRFFRKSEKRLAKAQRKLARLNHLPRTEPKKLKAKAVVQKAYRKVRNQRADFGHKLSHQLVNQYSLIVVEDLNIKGLAKGMLAKSVSDAGWSNFIRMLEYKAVEAGSQVIKVDPRYTSQTCPNCGAIKKKALAERWHECACGYTEQRDVAAARVILSRGLATLGTSTLDAVV
jgi:putative transposase